MPTELFSSAIQLGIGGLSVAGVIYISIMHGKTMKEVQAAFLKTLDERTDKHEAALQERENTLRSVEKSVRDSFTEIITKNTVALLDATKILGRVARHLDGESK